ncbi:MCE family protein [Nocardia higoensis]|uniref:MCE family protein n=1 Tax=Nocardia higoensis TaxID=228599 RepID=UPI0002F8D31B|nr:MCE family protein [Nocardia higoensis]
MSPRNAPLLKFGAFAVVMVVLSGLLILVFGQYRGGSATGYSAVFADASGLRRGDTVRIAGVPVGTVRGVELREDHSVLVEFDAAGTVRLTTATEATVRYLNLVGDRYLELTDPPGVSEPLPGGARIPVEKTSGALDLDLLIGGLKPVIQGLNAQEVNALTWSLLEIVQGRENTIDSLMAGTASFTTALAEKNDVVERLLDHLRTVMDTLSTEGDQFTATVDRLQRLVGELTAQRDPIGAAVEAIDRGTASVADLLVDARGPLAGTVDELARLAPLLDNDKQVLDDALGRAPGNFRKLVRTGAYGNFIQYYICAITVRINDPSGQVLVLPAIEQTTGRCSP